MAKSEAPQTGVTYFFTVATNEGQPLLRDRLVREALRKALHDVRRESPGSFVVGAGGIRDPRDLEAASAAGAAAWLVASALHDGGLPPVRA